MSATTKPMAQELPRSNTLPLEQMDLGQMSIAHAHAYGGGSSSAGTQNFTSSPAPDLEPAAKITIGDMFSTLISAGNVSDQKVTAMDILSRAWAILQILFLGLLLLLLNSKSGSTGDADDITDDTAPPPVVPSPRPRVKITAWRILNTSVLLILGTYKAVSTYLGQTMAPTDLDWTIGVVWALISYWVSILEQEAPSVAPWFFTTDLSRLVRFGVAGFFILLFVGIYWAVIYGMMAFLFSHPCHWTVLLAISVGIAGVLVLMLIGLAALALSMTYGAQLRNFFNDLRVPRFYKGLFRSSDWPLPSVVKICSFMAIIWLSPIGVTFTLATRPRGLNFESEVINMFVLSVAIPCATIYSIVVIFIGKGLLSMFLRLTRSTYIGLRNLFRKVYRQVREVVNDSPI
ncbi:hypothetical protein MVEN_00179700 [Mycena venus]|uniref:Transmembrane protein n=1 Tax=Mycena venus TaxID=2733690 RepID=A0A8H6Z062_9AGAR|nr:hypothetical protein MVEN_00179700 [Mycena venus]